MSENELRVSVARRVIIKFLVQEGVNPTEIFGRLTKQFKEETLSRARVFARHKQFTEGRERVENESHDRRPRTSVTGNNIRRVRQLLEGDRRLTVMESANEVGISYGSTINAEYYCKVLSEFRLAYRRKRRNLPVRNVILLQDQRSSFYNSSDPTKIEATWLKNTGPSPL